MERIHAQDLGISIDVDQNRYKVLINKEEKEDENRIYFLSLRNELDNKNKLIKVFFARPNTNRIQQWREEREVYIPDERTQEVLGESSDGIKITEESGWMKIVKTIWSSEDKGSILKKKENLILVE